MNEKDLSRLQRISESVKALSSRAQKEERGHLHAYKDFYETQYELVRPILSDNADFKLEFRALKEPGQISFTEIVPALINFSTFIDSVVKEETLGNRKESELFEKEYFIDENKPFTAYNQVTSILRQSVTTLKIVDNFLESSSLEFFLPVNTQTNVQIITKKLLPSSPTFKISLGKFISEWGGTNFQIRTSSYFHDRYLIIDDVQVWHLGPSLNYLGKKPMMISLIQDQQIQEHVTALFDDQWLKATSI